MYGGEGVNLDDSDEDEHANTGSTAGLIQHQPCTQINPQFITDVEIRTILRNLPPPAGPTFTLFDEPVFEYVPPRNHNAAYARNLTEDIPTHEDRVSLTILDRFLTAKPGEVLFDATLNASLESDGSPFYGIDFMRDLNKALETNPANVSTEAFQAEFTKQYNKKK